MKCCKVALIPVTKELPYGYHRFFSPDAMAFWKTRGCKPYVSADERPWMACYFPCPHLTDKGCDIYENRPHHCRTYDGRKDPYLADVCLWKDLDE